MKSRQEALNLLHEWVKSDSLRKHCLSVAASMEAYAKKYLDEGKLSGSKSAHPPSPNEDNSIKSAQSGSYNISKSGGEGSSNYNKTILDKWFICGLLHDFDWERNPTLADHPKKGCEELRKLEYDDDIIKAIMGHGNHTGVARNSLMAKTLFAVDELSGMIVALARVRPGNFSGMTAKSVKKAMKKKDFAAAINRDDIKLGIEELNADTDIHFELVINALSENKTKLGF
jgi:predicted hydrolase (HD superfamily)